MWKGKKIESKKKEEDKVVKRKEKNIEKKKRERGKVMMSGLGRKRAKKIKEKSK